MKQQVGLGSLKIPLNWWQYVTVHGGPFMDSPDNMFTVKMAVEINKECDISIPTRDFQVPDLYLLDRGLTKAVCLILCGIPVYVGCMGGKGRTGLFLAVLCKAFGVKDPVEYVRKNYYPHAVETAEQYSFVNRFVINPQIRMAVKNARYSSWARFWKRGVTRNPSLTNDSISATL